MLDKSSLPYTPLFCEENVWKLIDILYMNHYAKPIDVLFLINATDTIAIFEQNKSTANNPVIWDYHVILVAQQDTGLVIFDFDSRCEFPIKIADYFKRTFPLSIKVAAPYKPLVKSIDARYYQQHFYSNRQHMLGVIDESKFPAYDIIQPDSLFKPLSLAECRDSKHISNYTQIQLPYEYLRDRLSTG